MFCSACGAAGVNPGEDCTACGAPPGGDAMPRFCTTCGAPALGSGSFCTICGMARPVAPSAAGGTPPGTAGPTIGVGRRALATLIDLSPAGLLYLVITALLGAGGQASALPVLLWLVLLFAGYVTMEARWGGTFGKLVAGLRIARRDGSPAGWREALLRTLLRPVDALLFYLVGAVAVWNSAAHQRLGDRLAGTVILPRIRR